MASKSFRYMALAFVGLVILLAPLPMFSQSCSLCYTQAASSGARMIQALKSGILVLIIPPTLASVGLIFVVHRKNNEVRCTEAGNKDSGQDW
jgi:hypothetical protein